MRCIRRVFISVLSEGCRVRSAPVPDPILMIEASRCRIGMVMGVIQVLQISLQEFRINA